MAEKIQLIVANPAGNTTILVLSPVDRERYAEVAGKLLQIDFKRIKAAHGGSLPFFPGTFTEEVYRQEIRGEQVGFVLEDRTDPETGEKTAAVEMAGMEFCGNAFRAFACWKAQGFRPPLREVRGKMSGCEGILTAAIDAEGKNAEVTMPLPVSVSRHGEGVLVDLGGIAHLVLPDAEPSAERFEALRKEFNRFSAFGAMFMDGENGFMTPVVYVRDAGTMYFEGSCASGTTAAAVVETLEKPDGTYRYSYRQPAGTLEARVVKESGRIREIRLGGPVELSQVIEVEI
ncbi:MAG: hypothetical protein IKT15_02475 [Firmicutes bacterium]|nr:hypothetical protein [Bacillota bacterium]